MNPTLILSVIEQALTLINKIVPDDAEKISNKIKDLRSKWDEEYSKLDSRDDALLDCIELELRDISELFFAAVKKSSSQDR